MATAPPLDLDALTLDHGGHSSALGLLDRLGRQAGPHSRSAERALMASWDMPSTGGPDWVERTLRWAAIVVALLAITVALPLLHEDAVARPTVSSTEGTRP